MLFTEKTEWDDYVPQASNLPVTYWKSSVQYVEDNYIVKVLGASQLAILQAAYDASIADSPTPLTTAMNNLLIRIRRALGPLAIYYAVSMTNALISPEGIRNSSSQDSAQAFQWQFFDMKDALLTLGMSNIDNLYTFLETNKITYDAWVTGEGYSTYYQYLVYNPDIFDSSVKINKSRWLFLQILPHIENAEVLYIDKITGAAYFDELKTKIKADTLNPDDETVLAILQKALSNLAYSMALPELALHVDSTGVTVLEVTRDYNARRQAEQGARDSLIRNKEILGRTFLQKAKDLLNDNASVSVYPTYFASSSYCDPKKKPVYHKHHKKSKVFGM